MEAPATFRHEAMATWFEVRIAGEDAAYARQAAQAAFAVADRLEGLLSRYREESEIARIRLLGDGEAMGVSRETADCLVLAMELMAVTGGAFDPTLGAAMDRTRAEPAPRLEEAAPEVAGRLEIDPAARIVTRFGGRVDLDLGAIGKGFALDRMAVELADWEVGRALLVAGGSSILALDGPNGADGWEVRLNDTHALSLRRWSVGTSGVAVKGAHIVDPRTGHPAPVRGRAWALAPDAATSDALSTAFLLLPWEDVQALCDESPALAALRWDEETGLRSTALPSPFAFRPLSSDVR